MSATETLREIRACEDAIKYLASLGGDLTRAWAECQRGDWMLWFIGKTIKCEPWTDGRKQLMACALDCALLAESRWPEGWRVRLGSAVSVLRAWTSGDATAEDAIAARKEISAAYDAATYAAAYAADAAYATATYAAYATATYAADAAYATATYAAAAAAATATYAAAAAAATATYAAYADAVAYAAIAAIVAAGSAARKKTLAQCADLVRRHYPNPPSLTGVSRIAEEDEK